MSPRARFLLLSVAICLVNGASRPSEGDTLSLVIDVATAAPPDSSFPRGFTEVEGIAYFVANHPDTGTELWRTDGTPEGTFLVKDITPGGASSFTDYFQALPEFAAIGTTLFFAAKDDDHGWELWQTDGTPAGTVLVKDVFPGGEGSSLSELTNVGGTEKRWHGRRDRLGQGHLRGRGRLRSRLPR
jgi:ELWxxDGT repeat protein